MISLSQAQRSDRLMKATTSLTVAEFEALAKAFAPLWEGLRAEQTAEGTPRQRQSGGGRKGTLTTPELKLFFMLFYHKAYPSQDFVTAQGRVHWCSRTVPGRRHDKTVTEQERLRLPKEITVLADSGFAGLDPGAATLITPWKKPKGRKLHWQRRAFNRLLARARVKAEHTLVSVKRLRILRAEFRNLRPGMVDAVMEIGCTLHNYRWTCRQGTAA